MYVCMYICMYICMYMCVYIFRFVELPELYEGTGWGSMQPRDSRLATPNSVLGTPRIGGPGGMTPSVAGTPMSVAGSVAGSTFTASSTPLRLVYYVTARMYSHKNTKLFFLSISTSISICIDDVSDSCFLHLPIHCCLSLQRSIRPK